MNAYLRIILEGVVLIALIMVILWILLKKFRNDKKLNIRDASLSNEELEDHARKTAIEHAVSTRANYLNWPLPRMNENYDCILSVYNALNEEIQARKAVPPAAEWLLDNYYLIEEQVMSLRRDLTKKDYLRLPILRTGNLQGQARIFAVAVELVAHTDGQVDEKVLSNYLKAYQSHNVLMDREIWAVPVVMRLALLERIRTLCENIQNTQIQWRLADEAVDQWLANEDAEPDQDAKQIIDILETMNEANPSFVEHLFYRLRRSGCSYTVVLRAMDQKLATLGTTTEHLAQMEHNAQSVDMVSMGNCITSLHFLAMLDWAGIFESASYVEQILKRDPDGTYSRMDLQTRNLYRHRIEVLASVYNVSERHIANEAIAMAEQAWSTRDAESLEDPETLRTYHAGYYLIGKGLKDLADKQKKTRFFLPKKAPVETRLAGILYLGSIGLVTLLIAAIAVQYSMLTASVHPVLLSVLAGLVVLLPASEIAVSIVNWIVCKALRPAVFPRMELKEGIPESMSTIVAVPTLLPDATRVKELLGSLESHYLSNREKNLYFALIGAFKDSDDARMKNEVKIIETAMNGVKALNQKYAVQGKDIFFFFHRESQFNEMNNKWIGWERKRGALMEFNDLVLGATDTTFSYFSSTVLPFAHVKYVITLDSDTILPMGMAKKMIGTMAHPLNRPVINQKRGVVVEGYGLIQPRIDVDSESSNKSLFSRILTGQEGIDPYANAISDVYQDLFGEGIFTGKGIYDLQVFQKVLKNAIPENSILSHDLLEGSYVRTGLVTDLKLVDSYPSRYNAYDARLHRWVRGDWQLFPLLFSMIVNSSQAKIMNPLSLLSRWKIVDNLRRSLMPPALMILVALGFSILPGSAFFWFGLFLSALAFPFAIAAAEYVLTGKFWNESTKRHMPVMTGLKASFSQGMLILAFLPFQAWHMLVAIGVTLYRVIITKRNLLEWVTSADLEKTQKNSLKSYAAKMSSSFLAATAFLVFTIIFKPDLIAVGFIFFLLWGSAPFLAYWVSQDTVETPPRITEDDRHELGRIARKTWRYFEEFANARNRYLAPDNYQADPPRGIASRTSPTNIGLGLIATLVARDLGYICTDTLLKMIERTLSTIEQMPKWNGHLYNWYDSQTLIPLQPGYVSTVDSGNLLGYLITLREGLTDVIRGPYADSRYLSGIRDTLLCAGPDGAASFTSIEDKLKLALHEPVDIGAWSNVLEQLMSGNHFDSIRNEVWKAKIEHMLRMFHDESAELISQPDGSAFQLTSRVAALVDRIDRLSDDMKFAPLFDSKKQLFSIGFSLSDGKLSNSYYDLLASEARQTSYICIARGEIPPAHWFRLGRTLTVVDRYKGLVSWTGTMFEYLMPLLIMKRYKNTLLDETYSFVIKSQKKYGRMRGMPWGTSESGFNSLDENHDYQYKAIGIPWLGLRRGLIEDAVTTPYATFLALLVDPEGAVQNMKRLQQEGLDGPYGFYEAADYTPERLPFENRRAIVKSYMAHHQGMSLMAIDNFLNQNLMQKRFHSDPCIHAARLLLQEKVPANLLFTKENKEKVIPFKEAETPEISAVRRFMQPDPVLPKTHILTNGNYSLMITDRGTGYSKNKMTSVTRWRPDSVRDTFGMFFYLRDIESQAVWSATYSPLNVMPESYEVVFTDDKAIFKRRDGAIETLTEVVVASGDNAEIRRISLKNTGDKPCTIEMTSYYEVVLNIQSADLAHPAFSNLFVETSLVPERKCIIANRRPRSETDKSLWIANTVVVEGETIGDLQYETDRMQMIGRGHQVNSPVVMEQGKPLSNTVGPVLDPVMSIRVTVRILPGKIARIAFVTSVSESKERLLSSIDHYVTPDLVEAVFRMALARSQAETRYLNLHADELTIYQEIIPHILFVSPTRRLNKELIRQNRKGQSSLWRYGISGDNPVVLVVLQKTGQTQILREVLKAHEYWRLMDLKVDLVIISDEEFSYTLPLFRLISDMVLSSQTHDVLNKPGDVFILDKNKIQPEDVPLLYAIARISFQGDGRTLAEQVESSQVMTLPERRQLNGEAIESERPVEQEPELTDFNGLGGFSPDGREYVIRLEHGQYTPAPWINVIANPAFGFTVSEAGSGFVWQGNSRENKLIPWSNDAVSDRPGEVIYMGDDDTGQLWTATSQPIRDDKPYTVRHGFGYSVFEHASHGVKQQLTQFVPVDSSVKVSILRLENTSALTRHLSLTYYVQPVMGVSEQETALHLRTQIGENGSLQIRNHYNEEYAGQIAYMDSSVEPRTFTGDRRTFFGTGDAAAPDMLMRESLPGIVGVGLDPCAAIQVKLSLAPEETSEIVFQFGTASQNQNVIAEAQRYKDVESAKKALQAVRAFWIEKLDVIQVETPSSSMNLMLNGWLLYQVISCRLWARSGFYQSGGAFGFRDQLQDSLSIIPIWPEIARAQILLHASRQFVQGDVQHWWHQSLGKGTRTRFSDDLLWLPFVTAEYVRISGDSQILAEPVLFLEDSLLPEGVDERYGQPKVSSMSATLYDHCVKAIDHSLKFGEHGLPLMGSGDWNDGMNAVGNKGTGESVWLGWFLIAVLDKMAPVCSMMTDQQHVDHYRRVRQEIWTAVEATGWDGNWYRRAYFDNGTPLGSVNSTDCKIDSIAQTWSVLSGAGEPLRSAQAMKSLEDYLVLKEEGLIKLLTPPFDKGDLEPGYIKGYVPGIRENGGQYTHAATWVVMAFARLGDGDKACDLFELINPINHTRNFRAFSRYKLEPYVISADVYAAHPHTGRGGWSWYTGSAGWMYQSGLNAILGFQKNGDTLTIDPCIPKKWKNFSMHYQYKTACYRIQVQNPDGVMTGVQSILLDKLTMDGKSIRLVDDGITHTVLVNMGS